MGTSYFLLKDPTAKATPRQQSAMIADASRELGVRGEAGWYCTRDRVTLCKQGAEGVHKPKATWFDACPICGAKPESKTADIGVVAWVNSFTWSPKAAELLKEMAENPSLRVVDDLNRFFTSEEFNAIVELCPLRYNEPNVTL